MLVLCMSVFVSHRRPLNASWQTESVIIRFRFFPKLRLATSALEGKIAMPSLLQNLFPVRLHFSCVCVCVLGFVSSCVRELCRVVVFVNLHVDCLVQDDAGTELPSDPSTSAMPSYVWRVCACACVGCLSLRCAMVCCLKLVSFSFVQTGKTRNGAGHAVQMGPVDLRSARAAPALPTV